LIPLVIDKASARHNDKAITKPA